MKKLLLAAVFGVVGLIAIADGILSNSGGMTSQGGTATASTINVGTLTVTNGWNFNTNLSTMAPDFAKGYTIISTNAAFTVLAPIGVDANYAQTTVFIVTNTTAAAVVITPPAAVHILGTWYVTNLSSITFFQYGGKFTNAICLPVF